MICSRLHRSASSTAKTGMEVLVRLSYYSSTNPEWWPIAALCVGKPCEFILFLSEFCAVAGFYVKDGSAEEALGREAYERTSVKSSSYLSVSEDDEAVETPDLK